jgi:hypothetical protein
MAGGVRPPARSRLYVTCVWKRENRFRDEKESEEGRGSTTDQEKGEILHGRTTKTTYEYLYITLIATVTFPASSSPLP